MKNNNNNNNKQFFGLGIFQEQKKKNEIFRPINMLNFYYFQGNIQ